jgi:hypothetical protein
MNFPYYALLDFFIILVAVALWVPLNKRLDKISKTAAVLTFLLLCLLSTGFQYLCLVRVNAWVVHPENTWLIPFTLLHSPLEEYLFWWSFALIMIEAYLWPRYLFSIGIDSRDKS